jgi:hypothetical protein
MTDLTTSSSSRYPADRIQSRNVSPYSGEQGNSRPVIRLSTSLASKPTGRAHESRKLLAHILGQLDRRPKPPSLFDAFSNVQSSSSENTLGAFVETVKENVTLRGMRRDGKQPAPVEAMDDDTDDEIDRGFTTDTTYDLMVQLKNVLMMSVAQGWHIFDEEYDQFTTVVLCR